MFGLRVPAAERPLLSVVDRADKVPKVGISNRNPRENLIRRLPPILTGLVDEEKVRHNRRLPARAAGRGV